MSFYLNRRALMGGTVALGAGLAMPWVARAQSKTLVAATFPGTWNEADRNIIAPAFKTATGASVTQSIVLGRQPAAVRRRLLRHAASARCRQRRADRRISCGEVTPFQGAGAEISGQVGTQDHNAGDWHRLQSQENRHAAE